MATLIVRMAQYSSFHKIAARCYLHVKSSNFCLSSSEIKFETLLFVNTIGAAATVVHYRKYRLCHTCIILGFACTVRTYFIRYPEEFLCAKRVFSSLSKNLPYATSNQNHNDNHHSPLKSPLLPILLDLGR